MASTNPSTTSSPYLRPSSPSPSISPSLALNAIPLLDRSVSTPSTTTTSTFSSHSRRSRYSSNGELATPLVKRRGYMRPQGTAFADSARNRDSVMSLGSIAHMQYYFARTGLLDGKGGQLAKEREKMGSKSGGGEDKENVPVDVSFAGDEFSMTSPLAFHDGGGFGYAVSEAGNDHNNFAIGSPSELSINGDSSFFQHTLTTTVSDPPMLPPTVSTYKQKPSYSEPLPSMPVLRRELKEALQDACKVLEETQKNQAAHASEVAESSGFHEIQGLHILDILTLAIRAAKNYYTLHPSPQLLSSHKSERQIRRDLYAVLDVLKRMAARNFRDGMKVGELTDVLVWIEGVDRLIKAEEMQEEKEAREREAMVWREEGGWEGREREREWLFMKSFDEDGVPLPQWLEISDEQELPTEFLKSLLDGQKLVKLHNTLVTRSHHPFGEIKIWHTDVRKPYRRAENLRFWIKAAELRWEIKLDVPVLDVVNDRREPGAWRKFDEAVFRWAGAVRRVLMREWRVEAERGKRRCAPVLRGGVLGGKNGEGEWFGESEGLMAENGGVGIEEDVEMSSVTEANGTVEIDAMAEGTDASPKVENPSQPADNGELQDSNDLSEIEVLGANNDWPEDRDLLENINNLPERNDLPGRDGWAGTESVAESGIVPASEALRESNDLPETINSLDSIKNNSVPENNGLIEDNGVSESKSLPESDVPPGNKGPPEIDGRTECNDIQGSDALREGNGLSEHSDLTEPNPLLKTDGLPASNGVLEKHSLPESNTMWDSLAPEIGILPTHNEVLALTSHLQGRSRASKDGNRVAKENNVGVHSAAATTTVECSNGLAETHDHSASSSSGLSASDGLPECWLPVSDDIPVENSSA